MENKMGNKMENKMENKALSILLFHVGQAIITAADEIHQLEAGSSPPVAKKKAEPKAEPKVESAAEAEIDYFKACQKLILDNVKGRKQEMVALLAEFDARTLPGVDPSKLPELLDRLTALIGG